MLPAVEKVINQGGIWTVEIVGLRHTISAQLWQVAHSYPGIVKITTLDSYNFCLTEEAFLYDMMNDVPMVQVKVTPVAMQESTGDTWDPVLDKCTLLEKNKELKKSKYVHSSIVDNTGVFIQFIYSQCAHSPGGEIFGGIRINLNDPEKVPGYLDKYETVIKSYVRTQLEEHLIRAYHPGGLFEELTDEDFGIIMAWGTLSPTGRKASLSARGGGPIFYGVFPTLIEPINVSRDPSMPGIWTHFINCYVVNLINKQVLKDRSYLQFEDKVVRPQVGVRLRIRKKLMITEVLDWNFKIPQKTKQKHFHTGPGNLNSEKAIAISKRRGNYMVANTVFGDPGDFLRCRTRNIKNQELIISRHKVSTFHCTCKDNWSAEFSGKFHSVLTDQGNHFPGYVYQNIQLPNYVDDAVSEDTAWASPEWEERERPEPEIPDY
jgi:hypothetical protein